MAVKSIFDDIHIDTKQDCLVLSFAVLKFFSQCTDITTPVMDNMPLEMPTWHSKDKK